MVLSQQLDAMTQVSILKTTNHQLIFGHQNPQNCLTWQHRRISSVSLVQGSLRDIEQILTMPASNSQVLSFLSGCLLLLALENHKVIKYWTQQTFCQIWLCEM